MNDSNISNVNTDKENVLSKVQEFMRQSKQSVQSGNFYFENHDCPTKGEKVKIELEYMLVSEKTEEAINFGYCPYCETIFYNVSKGFSKSIF